MVDLVFEPYAKVFAYPSIDMDVIQEFADAHGFHDAARTEGTPINNILNRYNNTVTDGDLIPEISGRMCYRAFAKGKSTNHGYLDHVVKERHGNVFIHSNFSFLISGVSRALSHELVRHHVGAGPSQESQRFVMAALIDDQDAGSVEILEYMKTRAVLPPLTKMIVENLGKSAQAQVLLERFKVTFDNDIKAYENYASMLQEEIDNGVFGEYAHKTTLRKRVNEAARFLLPNACETRMAWTMNVRAALNFFERRGSIHADLEIRRLAVMMFREMVKYIPNTLKSYEVFTDVDGIESIKCPTFGI